ncbi:hypothetical protein [Chryseobacterium sp.]
MKTQLTPEQINEFLNTASRIFPAVLLLVLVIISRYLSPMERKITIID